MSLESGVWSLGPERTALFGAAKVKRIEDAPGDKCDGANHHYHERQFDMQRQIYVQVQARQRSEQCPKSKKYPQPLPGLLFLAHAHIMKYDRALPPGKREGWTQLSQAPQLGL